MIWCCPTSLMALPSIQLALSSRHQTLRPSLGDKPPWCAWWNEGRTGWRASRVAPTAPSRSDGEAALDPHHPARQRLSKRSRASTDLSGPGSLERWGFRRRLLRQADAWAAAAVCADEDHPTFFQRGLNLVEVGGEDATTAGFKSKDR